MQYYEIEMSETANEDLERITNYIIFVLRNPEAALSIVKGIRKKIGSLQLFPNSHPLDEDEQLAELGIRNVFYKNYRVCFMVDEWEKAVIIIYIVHIREDSRKRLYNLFGLE